MKLPLVLSLALLVAASDAPLFEDRFDGKLADGWSWVREDKGDWAVKDGALRIRATPGNLWEAENTARNLLLRPVPQRHKSFAAEVTVTLHQCRGNREGNWAAEGGYDPVADVLFNRINVQGYFLEYDTARAGGFEPLARLPKGKKRVVLGLVSTKSARVEEEGELLQKIEQAARFAPLEQLALSPQCGFASSIKGNPLGQAEQEAKLARIVQVASRIWGA